MISGDEYLCSSSKYHFRGQCSTSGALDVAMVSFIVGACELLSILWYRQSQNFGSSSSVTPSHLKQALFSVQYRTVQRGYDCCLNISFLPYMELLDGCAGRNHKWHISSKVVDATRDIRKNSRILNLPAGFLISMWT